MSVHSGRYEALGETLARAQDQLRAARPTDRAALRARLLIAASTPPRRHRWRIATTTLALAAGMFAMLWFVRTEALTFELGPDGEAGVAGAWIAAPADDERTLRFSDGSRIGLRPHARARVAQLRASGAHVVLESGDADVQVDAAGGRSWQIDAGPYRIEIGVRDQVTATRFFVGWDPATESFELQLDEGAVIVEGPQLDGMRSVDAGQLLRIIGADARVAAATDPSRVAAAPTIAAPPIEPAIVTIPTDAAALAPAAPPELDAARHGENATKGHPRRRAVDESAEAQPDGEPAPAPASLPLSWQALARAGDYRGALAVADAEGFDALCESLASRELLRLADVARFARKPTQAIAVLAAVRRRFPHTDAAATAAFERGRIALAGAGSAAKGAGDSAEAASWFETYLDERPRGPLAREAMGRLMEALDQDGREGAARATARRYLDRDSTGPHADLARRLLAGGD